MDNLNQTLYKLYQNCDKFFEYQNLKKISSDQSQDEFLKSITREKYIMITAVPSENIKNIGLSKLENLIINYKENSNNIDVRATTVIILYPGTEAESKRANMMKFINHIRYPKTNIIMITPLSLSSSVAKNINKGIQNGLLVKSYTYDLLSRVIPEHEYCPKCRILSKDEIETLQSHMINPKSLKRIFSYDPLMVWYGANPGDVIEVILPSEVTLEMIEYALVI